MPSERAAATDELAIWAAASEDIRSVVKWIAAAFGALGALLIGTAPLTDLKDVIGFGPWLLAVAFGALALCAVGLIVWRATSLLTPTAVTLPMVQSLDRFAELRARVAADPAAHLGSWGADLDDFIQNREADYAALANVDHAIAVLPSNDPNLSTLIGERPRLATRVEAVGAVSGRLLAIANFYVLSDRFSKAKRAMFVAAALAVLGVVGFVVTTSHADTKERSASLVSAVVALTPRGSTELEAVLGPRCPRPFQALLLSGGISGPWQMLVTDDGCTRGTLLVKPEQAAVLNVLTTR